MFKLILTSKCSVIHNFTQRNHNGFLLNLMLIGIFSILQNGLMAKKSKMMSTFGKTIGMTTMLKTILTSNFEHSWKIRRNEFISIPSMILCKKLSFARKRRINYKWFLFKRKIMINLFSELFLFIHIRYWLLLITKLINVITSQIYLFVNKMINRFTDGFHLRNKSSY